MRHFHLQKREQRNEIKVVTIPFTKGWLLRTTAVKFLRWLFTRCFFPRKSQSEGFALSGDAAALAPPALQPAEQGTDTGNPTCRQPLPFHAHVPSCPSSPRVGWWNSSWDHLQPLPSPITTRGNAYPATQPPQPLQEGFNPHGSWLFIGTDWAARGDDQAISFKPELTSW